MKYKLDDVAEFQKGFAFKSKQFTDLGTKIVKVSNLTNDSVNSEGCVYIDSSIERDYIKYRLNKDDIIIATVGSWPNNPASVVGKVVKVPGSVQGSLLNQNAVRVKAKENFDQNYLYYLLKDMNFRDYIIGTAQGSANQASINQKDIKNFTHDFPCEIQQKSIANVLASLDEKIEANNQINNRLEEMAQAIFKHWFVDFEFPNEEERPYKSSDGMMYKSELGMIPEGWKIKGIADLTKVVSKGTTPTQTDMKNAIDELNVKFLKVKDIDDLGCISIKTLEKIPTSIHCGKLKRSILKEWDILFSIAGTIGRVATVDSRLDNSNTNQAVAFIRLNEIQKMFLFILYLLKSDGIQNEVKANVVQAVQANVSLTTIKNLKFALPNDEILVNFNNIVSPIFQMQTNISIENEHLIHIRDTLLPKLMSGEIRISVK
ncbi:restriction endonuclease subunit S [Bacillus toyonensis]|uniref:restriction endonuclease subunit S n=1 Tax=Bacillus toyonensis TaxID=155322 RepID=UPI000BF8A685|nr:restriction endonuclease subunit S [Bacillus toyonensis]PFY66679.1 hypothetical protein COL46_25160 [Bacillus toyonensis]